ncbi:MAG: hypothetical protein KGH95_08105 [Thaumarchaeota archaeon]|nr:hypothetical protein [Nitrososphaerota archaeon]
MKKRHAFRAWFYFRQGWALYFAFIVSAINTMVTTYYLAIEKEPILKQIFPSFSIYLFILSIIGVPTLVAVGYIHFKRIPAFQSEADITTESNPYYYKVPPGYWREVYTPIYLVMTKLLIKSINNEKLTEAEINEITELQKKLDVLIKGGYIGKPPTKSFSSTFDEKDE